MLKLPLTNIHYVEKEGQLNIFYRDYTTHLKYFSTPYKNYYYTVSDKGKFTVYGNNKLKVDKSYYYKKYYNNERDFEFDVIPEKRYLLDNVEITKTKLEYMFMDIEIVAPEFPNPVEAKYPITVIVVYSSFSNQYYTFCLPDYQNEESMLLDFSSLIVKLSPDLLMFWNASFDWIYLLNRYPLISKFMSPVGLVYIDKSPVGISILDYMLIDKKFTQNRKKSYALEMRAYEELGYPLNEKTDFTVYSKELVDKCKKDVERMVKMEEKLRYIDLCDDIRIMSKCLWSDIYYNSRIIDQLMLQEVRKMGIVLPNQTYKEETTFEAAYRIANKKGLFQDITQYDLSGAYLYTISDLCIDKDNIVNSKTPDSIELFITKRETNEIVKKFYMRQNPNALLPRLAKKLIDSKIKYKNLLNNTDPNDYHYKNIESTYNAVKSIYLSVWGVVGHNTFRIYNVDIASLITSTVRDLLHYVENKVNDLGYEVIYIDTDSLFINSQENLTEVLNNIIQQWSNEKFGKKSSIYFEFKGKFKSIIILDECRYKGYIVTDKGLKEEIKGLEIKRKDSSVFMSKFQNEVLDKLLLENYNEKQLSEFILNKIKDIYSEDIINISFPDKLSKNKEEYKTEVTNNKGTTYTKKPPIFIQAILNAQKYYPDFNPKIGENFYWLYTEGSVPIAFDEKHPLLKDLNIDYNKMIERNILNKVEVIYTALNWNKEIFYAKKTK